MQRSLVDSAIPRKDTTAALWLAPGPARACGLALVRSMPRHRDEGATMIPDDVAVDTARFLFLVRGKEAFEIAELRCRRLAYTGDGQGLENWKRVLSAMQHLIASGSDSGSAQN